MIEFEIKRDRDRDRERERARVSICIIQCYNSRFVNIEILRNEICSWCLLCV